MKHNYLNRTRHKRPISFSPTTVMGLVLPLPTSAVAGTAPHLSPHPSVSNAVGATNNDLVFQTELLKHGTEKT